MTPISHDAFDRLSEFAEHSMWKAGTPGMVLGVTDRDRTVFVSAKGFSDLGASRPMSVDTLFQIGSVSKSFTCMALLQQAEEGLLDVHDPVRKHLPWFSINSKHRDISLHHLMTHTAGIVMGSDATPSAWTEVWELRRTEATCEPGTYFHYSNSGYKVLGLVLETVSGRSYGDIIRDGVFAAVGMRSSEPVISNSIRGRTAVAHQATEDDRPGNRRSHLSPATWFEGDTADGSICAPLEDMLAYIRALLNGGEGPWGAVLSADSYRQMTTPYIVPDDDLHSGGYGYGLNIEHLDRHRYLGHQGGMVGHYTSMLMDVDLGVGVMVMVNGPGDPEEVARFTMKAIRASSEGKSLPDVPKEAEAFRVPDPSRFTGRFSGPHGSFEVAERDGTLHLVLGGSEHLLEPREQDAFFTDARGFELFLLEFEKVGDRMVRVCHGGRTYDRDGRSQGATNPVGEGDARYDGHYRSHNPWMSNFRVVLRPSGYALVLPQGTSSPMTPIGPHEFLVGRDERSPERVRFGGVIDGVSTCASVSGGGVFGRTFTP